MNEMDGLIQAMSNDDLAGLKNKYGDNASIVTLIDGILQARQNEAEQAKAKAQFADRVTRMFGKNNKGNLIIPHPEDVHNIYVRWGEADVVDGEPVEVEVVVTQAVVDKEGKIVTPAVTTTETRTPTHKEFCWIVELNKGFSVQQSSATGESKTSKRAITVKKIVGDTLELKGNFASASKACEHLGLTIGGDSAMRVLSREAYVVQPYDGTDFTG